MIKKNKLFDLHDANSGLINYVSEIENELNHPEIFVAAATSCDLKKYGLPVSYKINGSGAGLTLDSARISAIGETLERYCLSIIKSENLILNSSRELRKKSILHVKPEKWSLFSKEQDIEPFTIFDDNAKIVWTLADSLTEKVTKYVPASLVYLPYYYHFKDLGEQMISPSVSTGAACATTKEEALLKGIAELIERDSFMIMWRGKIPCKKVEIDEFSSIFEIFNKKFIRPGLEFNLYLTQFDFEMPSFFGVLVDHRKGFKSRVVGGAAHPNPEVAALKTLLELVQGLVWKDYKGNVDFPIMDKFQNIDSFESRMELYAYNDMTEAFTFLPVKEKIKLSEIPIAYNYDACNLRETLGLLIKDFDKKNYEILAVDMNSLEAEYCDVHIVKVLIPALEAMDGEHKYQYLGGDRWKNIPFDTGYINENEKIKLNTYPHPYP
ncbi:YcaO-like family protein [Chryseobacterium indologenes]|uniref:YcaO-like family protein n=1 Tax=Chryseobacterium indologenes TaxID=253 RepID=UPI0003E085F5|nr:YcaO-like family protein [Chryseobacterium indologenes]QPQ51184.1 YcaO-like family protein [Chryseobacterium indologenes]GAE66778.1 hypothetical protein CIN01S_18_01050 [Chryseobacterium indologenes NBRC 14944]SFK01341.1 thiazole/oxazole-forming peptide maturase, SagD family component [Chryseobacterium indologenes]SUX49571.1 bacteriocin biosynthesis docking scaffold, SagD family [Chryseobacterium indologenes]